MKALMFVPECSRGRVRLCARRIERAVARCDVEAHRGHCFDLATAHEVIILESLRAGGYETVVFFDSEAGLASRLSRRVANGRPVRVLLVSTSRQGASRAKRWARLGDRGSMWHLRCTDKRTLRRAFRPI